MKLLMEVKNGTKALVGSYWCCESYESMRYCWLKISESFLTFGIFLIPAKILFAHISNLYFCNIFACFHIWRYRNLQPIPYFCQCGNKELSVLLWPYTLWLFIFLMITKELDIVVF